MGGTTSSLLVSTTGIFLAWSALSIIARTWSKLRTTCLGCDDYIIYAAFGGAVAHVGMIFLATQCGYGLALSSITDQERSKMEIALYADQLLYVLCQGLCRISTALFIASFSVSKCRLRTANALAVITGLWTGTSVLVLGVRGKINQPWALLEGSEDMFWRWVGVELSGLILELGLWAAAIKLTYTDCWRATPISGAKSEHKPNLHQHNCKHHHRACSPNFRNYCLYRAVEVLFPLPVPGVRAARLRCAGNFSSFDRVPRGVRNRMQKPRSYWSVNMLKHRRKDPRMVDIVPYARLFSLRWPGKEDIESSWANILNAEWL